MKRTDNLTAPEAELMEVLLDFIIVSANLAKKIHQNMKQKQIRLWDAGEYASVLSTKKCIKHSSKRYTAQISLRI